MFIRKISSLWNRLKLSGLKPGIGILIIALVLGHSGALKAQNYNQSPLFLKANSKWTMGNMAGLDFSGGTPMAFASGFNLNVPPNYTTPSSPFYNRVLEGSASVADPVTGDLLFYTGGPFCYNANGNIMPNGDSLWGNWFSTAQGVCAVPIIDSPGKYFLFNLHGITDATSATATYSATPASLWQDSLGDFFYSVVDMGLDGGMGDIAPGRKNILLHKRTASERMGEGMLAIPGNNCDIWLVIYIQRPSSCVFLSYHITPAGLDTVPVVSPTNDNSDISSAAYGMAVSPNRSMIAFCGRKLQLFRFDPNTGILSDRKLITNPIVPSVPNYPGNGTGYVPAFSPDNTKLYFSDAQGFLPPPLLPMLQCEVGNFVAGGTTGTPIVIGSTWVGPPIKSSYLRLYGDTIYFTNGSQYDFGPNLGIIASPNNAGTACNYIPSAIAPATGSSFVMDLPNEVVYPKTPIPVNRLVLDTTIECGAASGLRLHAPHGALTQTWDNGETGGNRQIGAAGTYWVSYNGFCSAGTDTFRIRNGVSDTATRSMETYGCVGVDDSVRLSATPGGTDYLWDNGMTDSVRYVKTPGTYVVSSIREDGCLLQIDSFHVIFVKLDVDLGPDTTYCWPGLVLNAITPGANYYLWQDESADPTFRVKHPGQYRVTVRWEDCTDADSILVTSDCNCIPFIPNAFSPNKDQENDVFEIKFINCPVANFNLSIYNRWGQKVFETDNPEAGWDGTFKGKLCDLDVYFYYLRYETPDDQTTKRKAGDLTLVR